MFKKDDDDHTYIDKNSPDQMLPLVRKVEKVKDGMDTRQPL